MKLTKEQKEAIEELSKKAVICNYEERDYPNMICFKKDMIILLNLVEKLQKENEKLKTKLLDTIEGQKVIKEETPQYIKENYISKEKVKNMIKEKEWALENYNCDKSDYKQSQAIGVWDILQKLLKESEE